MRISSFLGSYFGFSRECKYIVVITCLVFQLFCCSPFTTPLMHNFSTNEDAGYSLPGRYVGQVASWGCLARRHLQFPSMGIYPGSPTLYLNYYMCSSMRINGKTRDNMASRVAGGGVVISFKRLIILITLGKDPGQRTWDSVYP